MDRSAGPPVVIVGGFLTFPPAYRRMRARLLRRGAASVRIAPLWTPTWLVAAAVGLQPLLDRTRDAIDAEFEASGQPVLVIGHSAGGLLARLALGARPFKGRRVTSPDRVGALVTLGTPHQLGQPRKWSRITSEAARFLADTAPGAYWAPTLGYLAVGSRYVEGGGLRAGWRRWSAGWHYGTVMGPSAAALWGDSVIPVDACALDGARCLTLHGIAHGHAMRAWYGDDPGLDGWWDAAVDVWRTALRARADASVARFPTLP